MIINKHKQVAGLIAILAACALLGVSRSAQAANKITVTPTPITFIEGDGQHKVVTVSLLEPIIADPGPAYLTLTITSTAPDRVSISTSTLSWTQSDWFQPKTFTIDAVDDHVVNGDANNIVNLSVDSNSEFYAGYIPTITVNVHDNDVALQTPEQEQPAVLPQVGRGLPGLTALIVATIIGGVTFALHRHGKIRA